MHRASLASQDKAQKAATINQLISVWQASGKAPSGLEDFGVQPGQLLAQTPTEQLEGLLATQEAANLLQEQEKQTQLPFIQKLLELINLQQREFTVYGRIQRTMQQWLDFNASLEAMTTSGMNTTKIRSNSKKVC